MSQLLEFKNTSKSYGDMQALAPLNLSIASDKPEIVTIAGESGSGKSTLANLALGFTSPTTGQVLFEGQDIHALSRGQRKGLQRDMQAVFQDPFGVYNPFYRISHVFDTVIKNFDLTRNKSEAADRVEDALNRVGLRGADILRKYPHQLSGGQRQRIMMARAYLLKPKLIVADEPVSMVDASLRASILDVMMSLRDDDGISFLYITHDLATAYQVGDRILLLYQGGVAESGPATQVITQPKHPYVQLLIDSVPKADPNQRWQGEVTLPAEEELRTASVSGCRFAPRCPDAMDRCQSESPLEYIVGPQHRAACHLYSESEVIRA